MKKDVRHVACCVSHSYISVTNGLERSDGPERRPLEGARTRHQRPCRRPLRPERAPLALLAMSAHASSTVRRPPDDILAVYNDAASLRCAKLKSCTMSLEVIGAGS